MPNKTVNISIIICTYNRANHLDRLFESLQNLHTRDEYCAEIIFIDNNSTDDTKEKIKLLSASLKFDTKYLFEEKQGSSAAKNKGIKNSRGSIVTILDDDCLPNEDWLNNIWDYFFENTVDIAGGKVLLFNPIDLPISIRTSDEEKTLDKPSQLFGTIPGCNVAFRRNVLEKIGLFDERIGAGLPLAGEDVDLIYRALKEGFLLCYTPRFFVYHNHGRRTSNDAEKLNRSYVRGRGGFYAKHILKKDKKITKLAYWEVRGSLIRALGKIVKFKNPINELTDILYLIQGFIFFTRNLDKTSAPRNNK